MMNEYLSHTIAKVICNAKSNVYFASRGIHDMMQRHDIALGQLFRKLSQLPDFALRCYGVNVKENTFWRSYTLSIPDAITCDIHETFNQATMDVIEHL